MSIGKRLAAGRSGSLGHSVGRRTHGGTVDSVAAPRRGIFELLEPRICWMRGLADGLLAYWPFDGNGTDATITDGVGNHLDGGARTAPRPRPSHQMNTQIIGAGVA